MYCHWFHWNLYFVIIFCIKVGNYCLLLEHMSYNEFLSSIVMGSSKSVVLDIARCLYILGENTFSVSVFWSSIFCTVCSGMPGASATLQQICSKLCYFNIIWSFVHPQEVVNCKGPPCSFSDSKYCKFLTPCFLLAILIAFQAYWS